MFTAVEDFCESDIQVNALRMNPLSSERFLCHSQSLKVVSRYCDAQFQVSLNHKICECNVHPFDNLNDLIFKITNLIENYDTTITNQNF